MLGSQFVTLLNGGGRALPAYLGYAATGARPLSTFSGSFKYWNSRCRYIARSTLVNPRIILQNFYLTGATEAGPGAATDFTAAIEYGGVCYQALFSGLATVTVADKSYVVSDPIANLKIPRGDAFFGRIWGHNTVGMAFTEGNISATSDRQDEANGERIEYSGSLLTDRTMTVGTYTSSDAKNIISFAGVIATITIPSAIIYGDSISVGAFENFIDNSTNFGVVARAIGPYIGYCNMAAGGEDMLEFGQTLGSTNANRIALAAYASHVYLQHGPNDLTGGATLQQLKDRRLAIRNLVPGCKAVQVTITPVSNSSDNFTTAANQTVSAGQEAIRVGENDYMRTIPSGYQGILDVADLFEINTSGVAVRNGGRWIVDGVTAFKYTPDGLHPNPASAALVAAGVQGVQAAIWSGV